MGGGGIDRINLAQERDRWKVFVKKVMNLRAVIKCWEFLEYLRTFLASQEGLCSMELV